MRLDKEPLISKELIEAFKAPDRTLWEKSLVKLQESLLAHQSELKASRGERLTPHLVSDISTMIRFLELWVSKQMRTFVTKELSQNEPDVYLIGSGFGALSLRFELFNLHAHFFSGSLESKNHSSRINFCENFGTAVAKYIADNLDRDSVTPYLDEESEDYVSNYQLDSALGFLIAEGLAEIVQGEDSSQNIKEVAQILAGFLHFSAELIEYWVLEEEFRPKYS